MTAATLSPALIASRPRWYRNSVVAVLAGLFAKSWYSLAIIAVTLPSGWLGARLSR